MTSTVTLLQAFLWGFLLCLVVRGFFSFFEPYPRNQIHVITFRITEPVLGSVRRVIPPMGGFDLSFVVVFFGIQLLVQLLGRLVR
ncbi:MAG: YggT family protein [Candidatus Dormibacteraeota bacterium]|uniref:YggT family protein n=1 Tax=Candidatus Dormiibacter inghamiae TaxID=3127013 RepID=A0A934KIA0_9BACT|nr:YggT family protein [Candidatus Dormibacteraeota bacterium]MBJ7605822.1 YggT family protein [Candidatus Dormibacteraeota bacterium]